MPALSSAKAIGGIGAILVMLTFVPNAGAIFGIAGFIMILVAVKKVADELENRKVFSDMMTAVILAIIGVAVASLVVFTTVFSAFQNGYFSSGYPYTPSTTITTAQWVAFGLAIGLGLLIAWLFFLFSSLYLRRSYNAIGAELDVHMFGTAGLLYFIGAATAIIAVGFVLLFVAQILTAVAFFSIPEKRPEKRPMTTSVPPV